MLNRAGGIATAALRLGRGRGIDSMGRGDRIFDKGGMQWLVHCALGARSKNTSRSTPIRSTPLYGGPHNRISRFRHVVPEYAFFFFSKPQDIPRISEQVSLTNF